MKTEAAYLLDANILIALCTPDHVHFQAATKWATTMGEFVTCPVTEGALVRFILRTTPNPNYGLSHAILSTIHALPNHKFVPDSISYLAVDGTRVVGHKQVTDVYLVALAKNHGLKIATLDKNLVNLFPRETELISVGAV